MSRESTPITISALGFNVLPGEGFVGKDLAFTSSFYLITGLGATKFAGDNRATVTLGGGYQGIIQRLVFGSFST